MMNLQFLPRISAMSLFLILNMITQINLDDAKMSSLMQNGTIRYPVLQFFQ